MNRRRTAEPSCRRVRVMTLTLAIFLFGSVLCCWSVLRCMGNERERRMRELEQRIKAEQDSQAGGPSGH